MCSPFESLEEGNDRPSKYFDRVLSLECSLLVRTEAEPECVCFLVRRVFFVGLWVLVEFCDGGSDKIPMGSGESVRSMISTSGQTMARKPGRPRDVVAVAVS